MPKEYILETTPITARLPYEGVALFDDFSPVLLWEALTANPGEQVELVTYPHFSGNYGLKIRTKTIDASINTMFARRPIPLLHAPHLTLHVLFLIPTASNIRRLYLSPSATFDGFYHSASVTYDLINHKWLYLDTTPTEQDVPDGDIYLTLDKWHHVALTIDLETHKYVTFRTENKLFDLSSYSYEHSADPNITQLHIDLGIGCETNTQARAYFDTVLVTQR